MKDNRQNTRVQNLREYILLFHHFSVVRSDHHVFTDSDTVISDHYLHPSVSNRAPIDRRGVSDTLLRTDV